MNSREKSVKIYLGIAELHDKNIHKLFQCEDRYSLDASRLFHTELSSLDSSMNIPLRRLLGDERAGANRCAEMRVQSHMRWCGYPHSV